MFYSLIVAKHNPGNRCFGTEGEILCLPRIPQDPKFGDKPVFIGSSSKRNSEFGWVKTVKEPFTLKDFCKWSGIGSDQELMRCQKILLEALRPLEDGTPVAADFMPRGLPPKPVLVVHKVIFYSD